MAEAVVGWVGWELCLLPCLASSICLPETHPHEEREKLLILLSLEECWGIQSILVAGWGDADLVFFRGKSSYKD